MQTKARSEAAARLFWCVLLCLWGGPGQAAEPLQVGVRSTPPFAYQDAAGAWVGISVELWQRIAGRLELDYVLLPQPQLDTMLVSLRDGHLDVAIGALTVTAARERSSDFSHAFFSAGVGVATPAERGGLLRAVRAMLSARFLSALAALALLLLLVGILIWLLERRHNPQFPRSPATGIGDGFWWSAVTMTTVGYGDKAPITFAGRLLGLIWMFAGIITISGFTAAITSGLTIQRLDSEIREARDLHRVRVVSVAGSTAADLLQDQGIVFAPEADVEAALDALLGGRADALVYDSPVLRYLIHSRSLRQLQLLPLVLREDAYAIMLSPGSALREPINRELLQWRADPAWPALVTRYLGSP